MKYKYLFLDRDGVINRKIEAGYVRDVSAFEFLPGVLSAIRTLSGYFRRIIIVTNQQGIGKGLMTHNDLDAIHAHMLAKIEEHGGRIDAIYYAPDLEAAQSVNRKPGPGMATQAMQRFPEIKPHQSIMVGDSLVDMGFAMAAALLPIQIGAGPKFHLAAHRFDDLAGFAASVERGDPYWN